MNYEVLRRIFFDAIRMTADQRARVQPYYRRLENMKTSNESLHKIIKEFERNEVGSRKYIVEVEDEIYEVELHNVAGKSTSGICVKNHYDAVKAGKLIILCLSNIDDVLKNGKKTKLVPTKVSDIESKHKGSKWLYVNDYSVEPGVTGEVTVEIEIPEKRESNQKNRVYHITTDKSVGYKSMKERRVIPNLAVRGTVSIRRA